MEKLQKATLAAGCFWCIEAVFQRVEGVVSVKSGYIGGNIKNPTYREISSGLTGHAEALEIEFDESIITFDELLEIFWATHDPTTLNRQGADRGTQYRSAIFYHTEEQKKSAQNSKEQFAPTLWNDPVVTEITEAKEFYIAEPYHQNYYNQHGSAGYCRVVINPKIAKLKSKFANKMKKEYVKV